MVVVVILRRVLVVAPVAGSKMAALEHTFPSLTLSLSLFPKPVQYSLTHTFVYDDDDDNSVDEIKDILSY